MTLTGPNIVTVIIESERFEYLNNETLKKMHKKEDLEWYFTQKITPTPPQKQSAYTTPQMDLFLSDSQNWKLLRAHIQSRLELGLRQMGRPDLAKQCPQKIESSIYS